MRAISDSTAIRGLQRILFLAVAGFAVVNLSFIPHEPAGPPPQADDSHVSAPRGPQHWEATAEIKRFTKHELDLDRECNLSTWFATALLAVCGFLGLLLFHLRGVRGWLWVGLGFIYLSSDEMAQIHEFVGTLMWHSPLRLGFLVPPYPWVLLFGPLLLGFGIWMGRFVWRELAAWPDLRRAALLGLALLALAVPLEVVGGKLEAISGRLLRVESTLEECSELLGEIIFLGMFLRVVSRTLAAKESRPEPA